MKTRIKICGITNEADGLEAARLGVDFLGFVFYPASPRYVEPSRAAAVLERVRRRYRTQSPKAIGVFVDEEPSRIRSIRAQVALNGIQFSGDEPPDVVAAFEPIRFRSVSIYTLDRLGRYEVEAYLCDAHAPVEKGGTGRSYDYEALRPYVGEHRLIIAGGLTPDTVGGIIARLCPWGVDVSSALEGEPGKKDHARLRAFVKAVREADAGER